MDKYGGGHKDGVISSFWHYRDALSFTQCCNNGNAPDPSCGSGLCDDRGEYRQDVQGFPSLALLRRRYHFGECFGEDTDEPVCHARFCHRDEPARRLFRNVVAFWACHSLASTERRTDCWLCRMEQTAMRLRSGRLPWESLQSAEMVLPSHVSAHGPRRGGGGRGVPRAHHACDLRACRILHRSDDSPASDHSQPSQGAQGRVHMRRQSQWLLPPSDAAAGRGG